MGHKPFVSSSSLRFQFFGTPSRLPRGFIPGSVTLLSAIRGPEGQVALGEPGSVAGPRELLASWLSDGVAQGLCVLERWKL